MKPATVTFAGWVDGYNSNRMIIERVVTNRTRTATVQVGKRARNKDRERKVIVTMTVKDG